MEIKVLPLGDIAVNCYLVSSENGAIIIDPGFYTSELEDFFEENSTKEGLILLTHAHFDHIGGALKLREKTDVKIGIGEFENKFLSDSSVNLSYLFGESLKPFSADVLFKDKEKFTVGDIEIEVIHTPGHTFGGVSYLIGDYLFSGDTLFNCSIGRTDFPTGDFETLSKSIKKLYTLPNETKVLSGHGNATNIGYEKNFNPFVR